MPKEVVEYRPEDQVILRLYTSGDDNALSNIRRYLFELWNYPLRTHLSIQLGEESDVLYNSINETVPKIVAKEHVSVDEMKNIERIVDDRAGISDAADVDIDDDDNPIYVSFYASSGLGGMCSIARGDSLSRYYHPKRSDYHQYFSRGGSVQTLRLPGMDVPAMKEALKKIKDQQRERLSASCAANPFAVWGAFLCSGKHNCSSLVFQLLLAGQKDKSVSCYSALPAIVEIIAWFVATLAVATFAFFSYDYVNRDDNNLDGYEIVRGIIAAVVAWVIAFPIYFFSGYANFTSICLGMNNIKTPGNVFSYAKHLRNTYKKKYKLPHTRPITTVVDRDILIINAIDSRRELGYKERNEPGCFFKTLRQLHSHNIYQLGTWSVIAGTMYISSVFLGGMILNMATQRGYGMDIVHFYPGMSAVGVSAAFVFASFAITYIIKQLYDRCGLKLPRHDPAMGGSRPALRAESTCAVKYALLTCDVYSAIALLLFAFAALPASYLIFARSDLAWQSLGAQWLGTSIIAAVIALSVAVHRYYCAIACDDVYRKHAGVIAPVGSTASVVTVPSGIPASRFSASGYTRM